MVRCVYQDVARDDLLGPMFDDVAAVDWAEGLPKLTQFSRRVLLGIDEPPTSPRGPPGRVDRHERWCPEGGARAELRVGAGVPLWLPGPSGTARPCRPSRPDLF